jgi:hypothetical protein
VVVGRFYLSMTVTSVAAYIDWQAPTPPSSSVETMRIGVLGVAVIGLLLGSLCWPF